MKFIEAQPKAMPNELIFYKTPDGEQRIEVIYRDENFWMSQRALAELFGVKRPAITKHLGNIFSAGELEEKEVCSILEHTSPHGAVAGKSQAQKTKFYNLDAIIAVGYRVNSYQATQFRIWATRTFKEFVIKGFVMDDDRLKQGKMIALRSERLWAGSWQRSMSYVLPADAGKNHFLKLRASAYGCAVG